jgi:hypothetical protein
MNQQERSEYAVTAAAAEMLTFMQALRNKHNLTFSESYLVLAETLRRNLDFWIRVENGEKP